jgi:hypothetical protein
MGLQSCIYGLQGVVDPAEFLHTALQALTDPNLKNMLAEIKAVGK